VKERFEYPDRLRRIGQGRTADILDFRDGTVIKLYKEWVPREDALREFEVGRQAYALGIRTPRPIEWVERDGRIGIVFEKAAGPTILQLLLAGGSDEDVLIDRFAMLHAELHRHTVPADAIQGLPAQKQTLDAQIRTASFLSESEKDRIRDMLTQLPAGDRICHGDYHPDNVLLGAEPCLIDWMAGSIGDPAGDAARTVLLLRFGTVPEEMPQLESRRLEQLRTCLERVYLERYAERSGYRLEDVEQWLVPVAAARLAEGIPDDEKRRLAGWIRARLGILG